MPDILDSLRNRQPFIHRLRRQARKVKRLLGCLRLEAVFADEAAVLVHLKVDIVHADDACNIIFMAARRSRIPALLGPSERTSWHSSIVLVSKWVPAEPLRHEPTRAVCLLSLHDEELQDHERDDEHGCVGLCLLIQEVVLVDFEVQRHEALRGEQGNAELKRRPLSTALDVAMNNLRQPKRGVEKQNSPAVVKQSALEHHSQEAQHVEQYVEPSESAAKELLIEHQTLVQLRAPDQDEQARLESEAADEVPESRQSQVLHELSLALDRELEVDGEEEKVPHQVDGDRNR